LTEREHAVMRLMLDGLPNKLIADQLQISVRTVEVHRSRVFDKMKVKSAVELANALVQRGRRATFSCAVPGGSGRRAARSVDPLGCRWRQRRVVGGVGGLLRQLAIAAPREHGPPDDQDQQQQGQQGFKQNKDHVSSPAPRRLCTGLYRHCRNAGGLCDAGPRPGTGRAGTVDRIGAGADAEPGGHTVAVAGAAAR
jgi:DNA-binding CsgD family transcriptional regulator